MIIAISAGGWLLGMRNVMINTVAEDYVALAHAKGLPDRRVMTRYAARNAILPPLTGFASFFASAVGGLILVEVVFSYPGVGLTIQTAALGHDYPLVQALLLLLSRLRARRQLDHGLRLRPPRPAGADRLMAVDLKVAGRAAPPRRRRRRARRRAGDSGVPQSVRLLLANPKSAFGIGLLVG